MSPLALFGSSNCTSRVEPRVAPKGMNPPFSSWVMAMRETTRTSRSISSRGVNDCSFSISLRLHEREAYRRRHLYGLPCRGQAARCGINVENDDVVGFLVLRQQVGARGINREVPRRFAAGQNLSE